MRIYALTGGKCRYCGVDIALNTFHIDHIEPLSNGGRKAIDNLGPACATCNTSKSNRDLEHWRSLLAKKNAGWPKFTTVQLAWLTSVGANLPDVPVHLFWFEQEDAS
jgi:5-methylcytosine-specific restriction endonuclease McrA